MRNVILAAALVAAGTVAAAADPGDVGGTYDVRGTNLDGSKYTGTAVIKVISKTTCTIVWDVGSESSGICMRSGVALAAGYTLNKAVGLVIYEIRDDGVLDGTWTIAGEDGTGT